MSAIGEIVAPKRSFKYPTTVLQALLLTAICLDGVFLAAAAAVKVESLVPERERSFSAEHPAVGEQAPDFTLRDPNGKELHLHDVLGRRPLVLEFGSFT